MITEREVHVYSQAKMHFESNFFKCLLVRKVHVKRKDHYDAIRFTFTRERAHSETLSAEMSPAEYEVINKVAYPRFTNTPLDFRIHVFVSLIALLFIFSPRRHLPFASSRRYAAADKTDLANVQATSNDCLPSTGGRAVTVCLVVSGMFSPQSLISSISLLIQFSVFVLPINCIYIWNRQD